MGTIEYDRSILRYASIDLPNSLDLTTMASIVKKKGYSVSPADSWEELFHQVFLNEIEPHLGRGKPTIIYDYPTSLAALSRKKRAIPDLQNGLNFI